ncbi:MAG: hypothetical protein OEQ25_14260 [Gammaproteobacteria bacterium]|nr:hypothetical protein [Gammaproteobacteria bacterium]MDH3508294.1 hypothetical protein [Gammaproteobacteria bacterium]
MKAKEVKASGSDIDASDYRGPDRREANSDTSVTITSVNLRFDADGSAVWEAETDEPQRRSDDDAVRLQMTLNEERQDQDRGSDPGNTNGHRTLIAFEAGDE